MTKRLTLDRIVSVIEKQLEIVDREITEETHFADLGVDSLDRVEFEFALEEDLGVDLDVGESELDEIRTVGDLMRVVNASLVDAS